MVQRRCVHIRSDQLFAPPGLEVSEIVQGCQSLGKVDEGKTRMKDAADEADDEGGGQGARLLGHGVEVAHKLRGEVDGGRLGFVPRDLALDRRGSG